MQHAIKTHTSNQTLVFIKDNFVKAKQNKKPVTTSRRLLFANQQPSAQNKKVIRNSKEYK